MKYLALMALMLLPAHLFAQSDTAISDATGMTVEAEFETAPAAPSYQQKLILKYLAEFEQAADATLLIRFLANANDLNGIDEETLAKAENALLAYTKPLPATNAKANLKGYQALAILQPDNDTYQAKVKSYQAKYDNQLNTVLRKLKKKHSDFDNIDWYHHPREPRYADTRNYILPYMGTKDGQVWLRAELHYTSDSWLFVTSAKANIDGEEVHLDFNNWKRDNDSEIWEWSDVKMTPNMREAFDRIANSKKTVIRFYGMKFYDDWTVPSRDKQAILEMFAAEEAMADKLSSS